MLRLGYPTLAHQTFHTTNHGKAERFLQPLLREWLSEAYTTTLANRCSGSLAAHYTGTAHTLPTLHATDRYTRPVNGNKLLKPPHLDEVGRIPLRYRHPLSCNARFRNSVGEQAIR